MDLIVNLSTGKGTWGHVSRLISDGEWSKVYIITNEFGKENFSNEKNAKMIIIDSRKGLEELKESVYNALKDDIKEEIGLNLISGTGKEHMAILSAVLRLGVGIRFFALTKEGIKEL